jgi:hypothetical protein
MALDKFELKKEHLILLKHLDWEIIENDNISTLIEEDAETPFGGINLIEDIGIMLYGNTTEVFDPLSPYGPQYTDEQKVEIKKIFSELPKALEVVLFLQTFEVGVYGRKWNLKNWKKIA